VVQVETPASTATVVRVAKAAQAAGLLPQKWANTCRVAKAAQAEPAAQADLFPVTAGPVATVVLVIPVATVKLAQTVSKRQLPVAEVAKGPWAVPAATAALAVRPLALVSTETVARVAWAARVEMEPWAVLATPAQPHTETTAARPHQKQAPMEAMVAKAAQAVRVASAAQPVAPAAKPGSTDSVASVAMRAMGGGEEMEVSGSLTA
jgi:hypothetical protein